MANTRLTNTEMTALKDCAGYPDGHYAWKPATMRKLAAKGLVTECDHACYARTTAWRLTDAGRAALVEGVL